MLTAPELVEMEAYTNIFKDTDKALALRRKDRSFGANLPMVINRGDDLTLGTLRMLTERISDRKCNAKIIFKRAMEIYFYYLWNSFRSENRESFLEREKRMLKEHLKRRKPELSE